MKITRKLIRKVKGRDEFKIFLDMIKDNGQKRSIIQIISGSRGKAKGVMAMHLRNHTQTATFVELP